MFPELGEGSGQLGPGDCAELLNSKEAEGTWASLWGPAGMQPGPSHISHQVPLCAPFTMSPFAGPEPALSLVLPWAPWPSFPFRVE